MPSSILQENARKNAVPKRSALVVGAGLTASIVIAAIRNAGIDVIQAKCGANPSTLFNSCDDESLQNFFHSLNEQNSMIIDSASSSPTEIVSSEKGFVVTFEDRSRYEFGCVFLATEGTLKPLPEGLPAEVIAITPDTRALPIGNSVCFLLDYLEITNPSIGMYTIRMALANQLAGGNSFVLLRHTPVRGLFGETVYENARLSGVTFLRYGTELPRIERRSTSNGPSADFKVSIRDVIESGEDIIFESDCIFVGVNPVTGPLPKGFSGLLNQETDQRGFLIKDSVYCVTGKSFRRGAYCIGPSTGCVDLFETVASATATAIDAVSWLNHINISDSNSKMMISDHCVRCLTCLRLCPHSAIAINAEPSKSNVKVSDVRCLECGICVAECPRTALDLTGFSEDGFSSLIDKLRSENSQDMIVVFGCHRSAGRAVSEIDLPEKTIFFPVSCAGRLSESILSATLATGVKGILVLGCHHGNCRSNNGTDWAKARLQTVANKLNSSLKNIGLISYKTMAANESARMYRLINDFSNSAFRIQD